MGKKKKQRAKSPRRRAASRVSSEQTPTRRQLSIPGMKSREVMVCMTVALAPWFFLATIPTGLRFPPAGLAVLTVSYVLVNGFSIGTAALAARTFASLGRAWCFIGLAINALIVTSATLYVAISNSDKAAFNLVVGPQHISQIEALYFSVTTFSTTGFGDIAPLSSLARLAVSLQEILGFSTISVVVVLILSRTLLQQEKGAKTTARMLAAQRAPIPRRGPLEGGEKAIFSLLAVLVCATLFLSEPRHQAGSLLTWQWATLALLILSPPALACRIIYVVRDPSSPNYRIINLFTSAVSSTVLNYTTAYWLISNIYPSLSDQGSIKPLGRVDSLYFTLTTLTTTGFGDIVPRSDSIRLLVAFQQFTAFVLLIIALNFAGSRWKPDEEALSAESVRSEGRIIIDDAEGAGDPGRTKRRGAPGLLASRLGRWITKS